MYDLRWRLPLLALCAFSFFATAVVAADELGVKGRPWFGWWDASVGIAGPFTLEMRPRAEGAAQRSGLRTGDRIDLRRQTTAARVAMLYQPMGTQPTPLLVDRSGQSRRIAAIGGSVWDNASFVKLDAMLSRTVAGVIFGLCALFIALARPYDRVARAIVVVVVAASGVSLDPSFIVVPVPAWSLALLVLSRACAAVAALTLIALARSIGPRFPARTALEGTAVAAVVLVFCADLAAAAGVATLRFDPIPFIMSLSMWRSVAEVFVWLIVIAACATAAKARSALLPLPVSFFVSAACFASPALLHDWFANVAAIVIANVALPLGALLATRAALQVPVRRGLAACAAVALTLGIYAPPDHRHDFDFEFGRWSATLRMQPQPLSRSNVWITFTGTSVVHPLLDGKANIGELQVSSGTKRIDALSLRLYDAKAQRWNVYFANSADAAVGSPPTVGRFDDGRGVFYDVESVGGKSVRVRFVFSNLTKDSFQFVQSFSPDGGRSWQPNWIAQFKRLD